MKRHFILACFGFLFLLALFSLLRAGKKENASDAFAAGRKAMVESQIRQRGVKEKRLLEVLEMVPRHAFVPEAFCKEAYADYPLPIGEGQTISQPYIVALMTELLRLKGNEKVLEIGTGSGYQAAVLSLLCQKVFSIEIVCPLADSAKKLLKSFGYTNVTVRCGDGYLGWKEEAPFDAIIVTCAPPYVPAPLLEQLKEGGRMVIPVGDSYQELKVIKKIKGRTEEESVIPVRFVPMTGKHIQGEIALPKPSLKGGMSVEEAIAKRRSRREYSDRPLLLKEVSQLLWSAAGYTKVDAITGATRTAPSAGGLYPLRVFLAAFQVDGLEKGVYLYSPAENTLKIHLRKDVRQELYEASYGQEALLSAKAVLVYACDYAKVKARYSERGRVRYAHMDIGHSAENVYLQAEALGIGTVAVGAFDDGKTEKALNLDAGRENVLYLLPLGKKK